MTSEMCELELATTWPLLGRGEASSQEFVTRNAIIVLERAWRAKEIIHLPQ